MKEVMKSKTKITTSLDHLEFAGTITTDGTGIQLDE